MYTYIIYQEVEYDIYYICLDRQVTFFFRAFFDMDQNGVLDVSTY